MPWWRRADLRYRRNRLHLGRHDLQRLAVSAGTPLYVYHAPRVRENFARLRSALDSTGLKTRILYALKSNRFRPLVAELRSLRQCGLDVCSPGELQLALQGGFGETEISYTGTSLSQADAACLARHPGVHVNCDSLSAIRRIGRLCPGRRIGLRINPACGMGYRRNPRLRYAGAATTKFGIYREQFREALELARRLGLKVMGLHVHAGCGFLTPQLPAVDRVLAALRRFIAESPPLEFVNLGGGLGIPLVEGDEPLDLARWAGLIRRHFRGAPFEIWVEPGDYLVKDAGVLLLEVTHSETKRRTRFVGVNGGFNLHPEPAFYGLPLEPVPCVPRPGAHRRATLAGNINEALDVFAEGRGMPPLAEGDILALLNAGGYGAAMSSNHCARGGFAERLLS